MDHVTFQNIIQLFSVILFHNIAVFFAALVSTRDFKNLLANLPLVSQTRLKPSPRLQCMSGLLTEINFH